MSTELLNLVALCLGAVGIAVMLNDLAEHRRRLDQHRRIRRLINKRRMAQRLREWL